MANPNSEKSQQTILLSTPDSGIRVEVFCDEKNVPLRLRTTPEAEVFRGRLTDTCGVLICHLELWRQRSQKGALGQLIRRPSVGEEDSHWAEFGRSLNDWGGTPLFNLPVSSSDGFLVDRRPIFIRPADDASWPEVMKMLSNGEFPRSDSPADALGWWLHGWKGEIAPLAEVLFLKLMMVRHALSQVLAVVRNRSLPFLNLSPDSFGVHWHHPQRDVGLRWWSARTTIRVPSSAAVANDNSSGGLPSFIILNESSPPTVFRHPAVTPPRRLIGTVRMRDLKEVKGSSNPLLQCQGTLTLNDWPPKLHDQLLIGCDQLSEAPIAARVTASDMNLGEISFVTGPWQPIWTGAVQSGLPALEAEIALLPDLGPGADLHSMGVIILDALLAQTGRGLPTILDEALRVAKRLDQASVPLEDVANTLAQWAKKETGQPWVDALNAKHLAETSASPDEIQLAIPAMAWWSVIAWTLKLFSGSYRHAYVSNAGGGTEGVRPIDQAIRDLDALLPRMKSLVLLEWRANLELRSVIQGALAS